MRTYRKKESYKEYQRNYQTKRRMDKASNYVYFIKENNGMDDLLYVGSCSVLEDRMAIHKCIGKIKEAIELGVKYEDIKVFYLELPDWTKEDRELLEYGYIDTFKPRLNNKAKDYRNERTLELLKQVDVNNIKEFKI